ncbi:MAG TPA: aminoglycoside phosphotransferase [Actinophytocola sp.]|uniref:maltokinase N-terminal cap-like domain-containing protein n=1 Tax=Actinophytocola sp. TaxID=1872138 RepID=UPI002DBDADF0|nr:aminoglycoside phosphotransferase [Actinophytocola sp.]HEU5470086.1 aminoglycoside phosphotransferase [Actinophytocola sp.]
MREIQPEELVADLHEALRRWLPEQRWFGQKGRGVDEIRTVRAATVIDGEPALVHALVEVSGGDVYQLMIGVREHLSDVLGHAAIGRSGELYAYDAPHDPELMGRLLDLVVAGEDRAGLLFRTEPDAEVEPGMRARPVGVEQSNTSVIYGQDYILKLYRRASVGNSRDLELHRALRAAGSVHIANPLGAVHGSLTGRSVVLAFLQRFLSDGVEGWATATASVRDLLAEGDLHADEVGGDFAGEAARLGTAVAEVHADLASVLGSEQVGVEQIAAEVDAMHARLDAVLAEVPELREHAEVLRMAFDEVRSIEEPVVVQQVHGDLHLGQVMRSTMGWVLIDFEGEPAASPQQRLLPRSPLRDVAGMLRSFDYAAFHLLAGAEEDRQLLTRATEWSDRNRSAFCEGYAKVAGDPRDQYRLLRAFELDKAVYEVAYEHHNRPDWLPIPLVAIRRESFRVA